MDVDASQYAEMSRELLNSDNYLFLYDRGVEYLDKPPFLFWVSALSMKIFGVNNFGYKLPSILFALWAIFATYRLARLLYNDAIGRIAALVLGVCQGLFLMTNDVRTDTILMGAVISAIWMIKECDIKRRWYYVLGGTLSIAIGMMTKGPIALMIPVFCFGTDWILKRQWKKIFNPYHLVDALLIAIFLIPMSIGLYQQFDLHPEKTVNGLTNVSGLRFFYWSQSFGRITGESPWNNGAKLDFLMLNMLWSFLPWILIFIPALIINVVKLFKQKFKLRPDQEWITTGGFILGYLALGSSKYQLPHYIFVVFPLAAIIVAQQIGKFFEDDQPSTFYKIMKPVQIFISFVLMIGSGLTVVMVFNKGLFPAVVWLLLFFVWMYIWASKKINYKLLWVSASAALMANIILTHHFYYNLLKYEVGAVVGRYIHQENIPTDKVYTHMIKDPLNALHFYAHSVIKTSDGNFNPGEYILTGADGMQEIKEKGVEYNIMKKGPFYKVTELTGPFLNPETRYEATKEYYFVHIK